MEASVAGLSLGDRERILTQSLAHFRNPSGNDLLRRTGRFHEFLQSRARHGLWPYTRVLERATGPETLVSDISGIKREGINFASQDYLGLSRHPQVIAAGVEALHAFGAHSAGSAILLGNTRLSLDLEEALAGLVAMDHVTLYPTGWAAGYAGLGAFVRPRDYIVMDYLAHASLQQGAAAATPQLTHFNHNDASDLRAKLADIRAKDASNGIMVVTEGLFSMDSDTPDLRVLQETAHEFGATLFVDVAHDLGALGPGGGGALAERGMLGKVDLVMGSFSKTFASNGGFLACSSSAVKQYAKYFGNPHMFSNALSPTQAAIVAATIKIVRSTEGDLLRSRLLTNVNALRDAFREQSVQCIGTPSAIVPVPFHNDRLARLAARRIAESGVFANLVEYPAVPVGGARLRMQVMATHEPSQAREAVARIMQARRLAEEDLATWQK